MTVKKRAVLVTAIIFAVFLVYGGVFLYRNMFTYTNLVDPASRDFARSLLEEAAVPQENVDSLFQRIEEFYRDPYPNLVKQGFQRACALSFSYRDTDAFEHAELQPDSSLTCRMAAFLLLRDSIVFSEQAEGGPELKEKDPTSRRCLTDENDLLHYDLLFANLTGRTVRSSAEMAAALVEYWETAGILFPEESNCNLLTAYGSNGDLIQNFHTAVVVEREDGVWLLEKYDPLYPYQLSCFNGRTALVNYMKLRVSECKYAAIFLGNDCLWSK